MSFHDDYVPAHYTTPKENGYYMTIRCGLSGIYTALNEWKDGKWMAEALERVNKVLDNWEIGKL